MTNSTSMNTWMENKIKKLHERCLRTVCNDKKSSFKELLETDKSVPIHIKNLQVLATEMFKVQEIYLLHTVRQLFLLRINDYYLPQFSQFNLPNARSAFCGRESILFFAPKIWNIVPNEFKQETALDAFKKLIKKWQPENCPCKLCICKISVLFKFDGHCYLFFLYCIWLLLL